MPLSASPSLLLVLAWDDADLPGRTEGIPARPAALPLLRALAARQPLLAVLPHLPDGARATPGAALPEPLPAASFGLNLSGAEPAPLLLAKYSEAAEAPVSAPESGVAPFDLEAGKKSATLPSALSPAAAASGEFLLPTNVIATGPAAGAAGYQSRLLGVAEALPAALAPDQPVAANDVIIEAVTPHAPSPAPTVSLRLSLSQQAALVPMREPAAPYQGRSASTSFPAVSPVSALLLPPVTGSGDGPASTAYWPAASSASDATLFPNALPQAAPQAEGPAEKIDGLPHDSGPELPLYADADDSLAQLETGPAEAAALDVAPELEFKPVSGLAEADQPAAEPALTVAPARASLAQGLAALGPAPPAGTIPFALADDLHYRIIQFARFAGPLAEAQGQKFGIIYAADWPTWLAALELRYRLRCPLVLHLTALAADQTTPAARGWLLEMERYALRRAQLILVPTEALRERVLARYPLVERVAVVAADDTEGIARAMADLALTY